MNIHFNKKIGDRILELRESNGLTKEEVVERMPGISLDQYKQWEIGNREFTAEEISKVANALNSSTDYLINGFDSEISKLKEAAVKSEISMEYLVKLIQLVADIKRN